MLSWEQAATAPAPILLVADDLMIPARVREGVKPLHLTVRTVATLEAAVAAASGPDAPQAVLVNLTARRYDPIAVINALKALQTDARPLPILAFAGHVEQEKHQLARAAGADMVAANSSIALHLPALLTRLLSRTAETDPTASDEHADG